MERCWLFCLSVIFRRRSMKRMESLRWVVLLLLPCVVSLCGCKSSGPGSASFASVTITNGSPQEICAAAEQVFRADGYMARTVTPEEMVFEKEASTTSSIAYGGIIPTHEGEQTWVRVRAKIVQTGTDPQRLQCQAFMVPHHGDSFFEEEIRLTSLHSKKYRKLLEQVRDKLN